jgi:uncharacterized protein (DUF433 family)
LLIHIPKLVFLFQSMNIPVIIPVQMVVNSHNEGEGVYHSITDYPLTNSYISAIVDTTYCIIYRKNHVYEKI